MLLNSKPVPSFLSIDLGADKAAEGHNLDDSLENLRALIKNDPFDGRAQYELASTLFSRVTEAQDVVALSKRSEPAGANNLNGDAENPTESSDQTNQDDQPPVAANTQTVPAQEPEIEALLDQAIQEYRLGRETFTLPTAKPDPAGGSIGFQRRQRSGLG